MKGIMGVGDDALGPLERGTGEMRDNKQHLYFIGVISGWVQFKNERTLCHEVLKFRDFFSELRG